MLYNTRKTIDLFDVQADYGNGYETVYTATSLSEAKARKQDYIANDSFCNSVKIHYYRERRNFCGCIIFSVSENNGIKTVNLLAKSNLAEYRIVQYYTFVEYCGDFHTPLECILEKGFANFIKSETKNQRQLQREKTITREELYRICTHYNNGKMSRVIEDIKLIDRQIPQGMYIAKIKGVW